MYQLLVKGGQLVSAAGITPAHLLVEDGKILALVAPGELPAGLEARTVIDAQDCWVFPGMVDLHAHIGVPGKENKEDITTGTRAAAAGGVTTLAIMPNSIPPVNSEESLRQRVSLFQEQSYVDFCMLGGAGGESLEAILEQAQAGVIGYKSYLGPYRPDRPGLLCQDTADILRVLEKVAETDCFIGFHCEDRPIIRLLEARLRAQGRTDFSAYALSRPEYTESLAALGLLEVARITGARLYLVHMSSPWAIRLAALWRDQGTDVTIETCPHYLLFTEEDTARLGPYAQVAPPLRREAARQELWELVEDGSVDCIATDHAPGTPEERELGVQDIFQGGGGLPALETVWPLLLEAVKQGKTTPQQLSWLLGEHPARIARIYPQKGTLQVGADADLVVVNPHSSTRLEAASMYTKSPDAARLYDGLQVGVRLEKVVQRGRVISENLRVCADAPPKAGWIRPG